MSINNTIVVNWNADVAVVSEDVAMINCYAVVVNMDDAMIKYACC